MSEATLTLLSPPPEEQSPQPRIEVCLTPEDHAEIRENYLLVDKLNGRAARQQRLLEHVDRSHSGAFQEIRDNTSFPLHRRIPERTGVLKVWIPDPLDKFGKSDWLINNTEVHPFPNPLDSRFIWKPLRGWVKSQKHHNTDQNLINKLRYGYERREYAPRVRQNFKTTFNDEVARKLGKPTVYDEHGGSSDPALIHRENRGAYESEGSIAGARVDWVRDVGGELKPVIYNLRNSANIKRAMVGNDVSLSADTTISQVPRTSAAEYHAALNKAFQEEAARIQQLRRQFDSEGHPLYFPQFIDRDADWCIAEPRFRMPEDWKWCGKWVNLRNPRKESVYRSEKRFVPSSQERFKIINASDVAQISSDELKELMQIWDDQLKKYGLGVPDIVREFPIRTLKETTEETQDPVEVTTKITDGNRILDELGALSEEQRQQSKDLTEKINAGKPLNEEERQRKKRMLDRLTDLNEVWHQAKQRLHEDRRVNGLYALVKRPQKAPRAYFLMAEKPALKIIKEITAAFAAEEKAGARQFSMTPYSIVKIQQARTAAAKRVKGKTRKAVEDAFNSAPLRILTF